MNPVDILSRQEKNLVGLQGLLLNRTEFPQKMVEDIIRFGATANIVVWNTETSLHAVSGAESLIGYKQKDLQIAQGSYLFFYEQVPDTKTFLGKDDEFQSDEPRIKSAPYITCCLVIVMSFGTWIGYLLRADNPGAWIVVSEGRPIDDIVTNFSSATALSQLLFIGTKYCKSVKSRPTRSQEKQIQRLREGHYSDISVVTLRKSEQKPSSGVCQSREFSCHFWVKAGTGFWRKGKLRPDGSRNAPEYVAPYLKGDMSKPLKQPSQVIYHAKR